MSRQEYATARSLFAESRRLYAAAAQAAGIAAEAEARRIDAMLGDAKRSFESEDPAGCLRRLNEVLALKPGHPAAEALRLQVEETLRPAKAQAQSAAPTPPQTMPSPTGLRPAATGPVESSTVAEKAPSVTRSGDAAGTTPEDDTSVLAGTSAYTDATLMALPRPQSEEAGRRREPATPRVAGPENQTAAAARVGAPADATDRKSAPLAGSREDVSATRNDQGSRLSDTDLYTDATLLALPRQQAERASRKGEAEAAQTEAAALESPPAVLGSHADAAARKDDTSIVSPTRAYDDATLVAVPRAFTRAPDARGKAPIDSLARRKGRPRRSGVAAAITLGIVAVIVLALVYWRLHTAPLAPPAPQVTPPTSVGSAGPSPAREAVESRAQSGDRAAAGVKKDLETPAAPVAKKEVETAVAAPAKTEVEAPVTAPPREQPNPQASAAPRAAPRTHERGGSEQTRVTAAKGRQEAEPAPAPRVPPLQPRKELEGVAEPNRQVPGSSAQPGGQAPSMPEPREAEQAAEQQRVAALQRQQSEAEQARARMAGARRAAEQAGASVYARNSLGSAQGKEQEAAGALGRSDFGLAIRLFGDAQSDYQAAAQEAKREAESQGQQVLALKSSAEQSRGRTLSRRDAAVKADAERLAKDLFEGGQARQAEAEGLVTRENFQAATQAYQDAAERYMEAAIRAQGIRDAKSQADSARARMQSEKQQANQAAPEFGLGVEEEKQADALYERLAFKDAAEKFRLAEALFTRAAAKASAAPRPATTDAPRSRSQPRPGPKSLPPSF
jgi:hypothetical protein